MKALKRGLPLLLAMVMLVSTMSQSVFAAKNVCVEASGSSAHHVWTAIEVETEDRSWWQTKNNLKFTQTKGEIGYHLAGGDYTARKETYGAYTIRVDKGSDGKDVKEYYWKYSKNYTLKLDENAKYTIQIRPYWPSTVAEQQKAANLAVKVYKTTNSFRDSYWKWINAPAWSVKSTNKVSTCVVS